MLFSTKNKLNIVLKLFIFCTTGTEDDIVSNYSDDDMPSKKRVKYTRSYYYYTFHL